MTEDETSNGFIDSIPDEMVGHMIKSVLSEDMTDMQNRGRIILRRFFTRNSIFTAKVQQDKRINIPQAEADKLDLRKGDTVQVFLSPIQQETGPEYECPDCHDRFDNREELLNHNCPEIDQIWGET